MILLVDNYDSFTYNLYQYLCELGASVRVLRNDVFTMDDVKKLKPQKIVLSPGPGTPDEAGQTMAVIETFGKKVPILGVCLGHQAMGQVYGGKVIRAPKLLHGKTSAIHHDGKGVFKELDNPFTATRYHSLIVERETLPAELIISAETEDGLIMGLRHRKDPIEGVQFHPESIMTTAGKKLLQNFLKG